MIDLRTCVPGQKVRFANGKIGIISEVRRRSGTTELRSVKVSDARWWWFTLNGSDYHNDLPDPEWQIVEILPVETPAEPPTVDLSTCVTGQKVKYRNGDTGTFLGLDGKVYDTHPFLTEANGWDTYSHARSGTASDWRYGCPCPYDIVEILPVEAPEEPPMPEPTPTPQEMDYKREYNEIGNIVSVAFPECEVTLTDMIRLVIHENRTLRMALGLPSYKQVSDAIDDEEAE
jgi:hypothetical protein